MALVLTSCTNRKRRPVPESLRASSLPRAELSEFAARWGCRLASAHPRFRASDVYGGRAFQEAVAAARLMDSRLLIVSAGLGLIDSSEQVPPYACTILANAPDSIASRVTDDFTPASWWRELNLVSPYSLPVREAVLATTGVVCVALSEAYLEMVAAELIDLPMAELERLRVFTRTPTERVPSALRRFVMPYDDRLDGPDSMISGTRSDFAGRAVRHFAEYVTSANRACSAEADAAAVAAALEGWHMPARFERVRYDDAAMRELIVTHWKAADGSSARLLRLFRDELNIACEQGRFAGLVREVRASRT